MAEQHAMVNKIKTCWVQTRGPFGTHQPQVPDNVPFPRLPSKSSARREQRAQGKGQGRVQHRRRRRGDKGEREKGGIYPSRRSVNRLKRGCG